MCPQKTGTVIGPVFCLRVDPAGDKRRHPVLNSSVDKTNQEQIRGFRAIFYLFYMGCFRLSLFLKGRVQRGGVNG